MLDIHGTVRVWFPTRATHGTLRFEVRPGWLLQAAEEARSGPHQVLAYASLCDADEITAVLVYPLRFEAWESLHQARRDVARAQLLHGGRLLRLEMRGLSVGQMVAYPPRSAWRNVQRTSWDQAVSLDRRKT